MTTAALLLFLLLPLPQLVDRTDRLEQPPPVVEDLSLEKRADIYMARKMYREATEAYQKALDADPDSARLYNKLGIAYHHQAQFREAEDCYKKAWKLDKQYSQAINNLGTIYYAQRRYKKAMKTYKKALKHAPYSASIYSNLGTAYFARRKYKQATQSYIAALELDPEVFEHRGTVGTLLQERSVEDRAKYHYFMAKAYAQAEIYDKALLYLRRALEEGYGNRNEIAKEKAFEPLHENTLFQVLVFGEEAVSAQSGTPVPRPQSNSLLPSP